jgi:type IV pilus assembly protein PilC
MTFTYKARDPLGKSHEGSVEAATREEATARLKRDGFQVLELEEENSGSLLPKAIRKQDIIYTTSQLAVMVDTGITLSAALNSIAEQQENPALRKVLDDLKQHVEQGDDFSSSLALYPKHFDKTYVALVRASEQTGTLGEMLETISLYLRSQLELRQRVRAAMAYPAVMLTLAICVTIFLLTYVLPKFEPLFSRKGVKLPKPTVFMMTASDALIDHWYAWLIGIAALAALYFYGRNTEPGRKILDWVKINLPIIGPMMRKVIISRSIRTLGTMVASGVSMLEAIRLAGEVSGNIYYEQAWQRVLEHITEGSRIAESLQGDKLFPRTLIQMIGAGEETGKLDQVLQKVSSYYDKEVESAIKAATSLIEPVMITAMGFVVGGIALGLLLPIFSLSRAGAG